MEKGHNIVNHPEHYTSGKIECIDSMELVFGTEAVYFFCICNAWKYMFRKGKKDNIQQEQDKAEWYLLKAKELKEKMLRDESEEFDEYDDWCVRED